MNERPLVSIGMPVFNGERHIRESIESLLAQTYSGFELIVSDNASTDSTLEICADYARKDSRITVITSNHNRGQIANFRRAFESSKGEYFAWAGAHDLWHPEWLESLVTELINHREVVLVYPQAAAISPTGEIIPDAFKDFDTFGMGKRERIDEVCRRMAGAGNRVYGLFRSNALRKTPVFPRFGGPDRLLLMELAVHGTFQQVDRKLWFRRFRENESAIPSAPLDGYAETIKRNRNYIFGGQLKAPWHSNFPVLGHMLGLVDHLSIRPRGHDYANALWGPYMAYLYFRRRKYMISKEFQLAFRRLIG